MAKYISSTKLSDTLTISKCNDGFWLYDKTRGMNLSMRAETETSALVEALGYYQGRLTEVERVYNKLQSRVDAFVDQFADTND